MAEGTSVESVIRDDQIRECPALSCPHSLYLLPPDAPVIDRSVRRLTIGLGQLSADEIDVLHEKAFESNEVFEALQSLHFAIDELATSVHELLRSHPRSLSLPPVQELDQA
jgi:hypothetical protein